MVGHTEIRDDCLHPENLPPHALRLWNMFWKLSVYRVDRGRISPTIIADWLRLNGRKIATLEMPVIEAMDAVFVMALAEETASNEAKRKAEEGR